MTTPRHRAPTGRERHAPTGTGKVSRVPARLAAAAVSLTALAVTVPLLVLGTGPTLTAAETAHHGSLSASALARQNGPSRSAARPLGFAAHDAAEVSAEAHQRQVVLAATRAAQHAAAVQRQAARAAAARKAARVAARKAARKAAQAAAQAAVQAAAQAAAQVEAARVAAEAAAIPAGSLKAVARQMMLDYGFGPEQWAPLDSLITRESGWNPHAQNSSSGAYGLPQSLPGSKMSSVAADWHDNPRTQITWMLGYVKNRFGTPAAAWSHSQSAGWY